LKPWREVVVLHRDILEGNLDESVFAAELSAVTDDAGPLVYRDAATFFRKTYETRGMVNLLSAVALRLAGRGGNGVIQLQTPFGGGKTHSLIALYHAFTGGEAARSSSAVAEVLSRTGLSELPKARVAAFSGLRQDTLKGKTPWGVLAEQLGNYKLLREHDQQRRAPGQDLLRQVLSGEPTLLLMDEIASFAASAKDYSEQVMAFFNQLTRMMNTLPECVLVGTLPTSQHYGDEAERALRDLQVIFGGVEALCTPVEGAEVYEVIRRRLFEETPDPNEARKTAESYFSLYQRLGDDVPSEVREPSYREKIRKAYPFHPDLIDTLYERWSTFPTFQRTRGVLRFLAEVVTDLYAREHQAPLIQSAHLNLMSQTIRRELLKHIGNQYDGVIAADITDGNAIAQRIDQAMGSEYVRLGVASGLATAIFFSSFSGAERKGVNLQRLRVAVLREGVPPALVGDAMSRLDHLRHGLWFLHSEDGIYWFSTEPNLTRVIADREDAVTPEQVAAEIRGQTQRLAGTELKVTLAPKVSQDVPDTKELKLAVLLGEYARQSADTNSFVSDLLKNCGTTFRTYQNTLLVLAPDSGELSAVHPQVKLLLALRSIRDDQPLMRQLSEVDRPKVHNHIKNLDGDIPFCILSAYRHLAKAGEDGAEWFDLGLPTVGERGSFCKRVLEYLKSQEILLGRIGPGQLLRKALAEDEPEKPLADVYEAFLRYPQLPMLESQAVFRSAVARGVREGDFGVRAGDRVYYKEELPSAVFDGEAALVRAEVAREASPVAEGEEERMREEQARAGKGGAQPGVGVLIEPDKEKRPAGVRSLTLRAKVPLDKLSDFVRGVVTPLRADGAEMDVEVCVQARSDSAGIKQSTLGTVRETLSQMGAEVLEESGE